MRKMTNVKNPRKDTGCNCYAYHRPRNTAQWFLIKLKNDRFLRQNV